MKVDERPVATDAPEGSMALPESRGYRIKKRLLGPPLHTERLAHERLGKPTALAVFASDNLSSSAYATEEILRVAVPAVGVAAFSLVVPITTALLIVLAFLILSYRQTIKAYPSAGGAYIVTRDNFGLLPAQVAGVALLTDYVLTVSVSVAAGIAAVASAVPALVPFQLWLSIGCVVLIAAMNLKGVRESGRIFAVPTYFFIGCMAVLLVVGAVKMFFGSLPVQSLDKPGLVPVGSPGAGIFYGATLYVILHAFASGGAAVTGVEAISNGVPAFKEPAWKNARSTLVIMGSLLGVMFLGLSVLASKVHAAPYVSGTPTVISQVGDLVFGPSTTGRVLYYLLQVGTMLILVLAANTSFADFPRLASFHAGDNFMPRQLTKRGHRLVFSNGIISLSIAAIVLLIVTDAKVDRLIPLYAIGVFTSFTLSQAGMAKHHIRLKEEGWRWGLFVNATGAALSLLVLVIIAITKFTHGAWVIVVLVPIMVTLLVRLNHQYEAEAEELEHDAPKAVTAPILRRHVVFVFVDDVNLAAARALQYARTLTPDDLRVVHFDLDPIRTEDLASAWSRLGLAHVALEIHELPDRRLNRAALELVAAELVDGDTEVTVLIPRIQHTRVWHRLLHDRTAGTIAEALAPLPHCNVTIVPYHLHSGAPKRTLDLEARYDVSKARPASTADHARAGDESPIPATPGSIAIVDAPTHQRVSVTGRIVSVRVQPWGGAQTLEATLRDATGDLALVFLGRRQVGGVVPGTVLTANGVIGTHRTRPAMLNPDYRLLSVPNGGAQH
ncbi:MAG TPA: amino acid permease [Acidimicrobiales bacterium]|nr:amino acid permease [Acidimicrobiales bacterium]